MGNNWLGFTLVHHLHVSTVAWVLVVVLCLFLKPFLKMISTLIYPILLVHSNVVFVVPVFQKAKD